MRSNGCSGSAVPARSRIGPEDDSGGRRTFHTAGVSFGVLGDGESCTGDPARRSGNEFLYQQLAMQNVEVLRESQATKVVATCAHCFNTIRNEYPQLGLQLEVVHHTQLLNRLVRDGRLTPVPADGSVAGRLVTYHDPCYLGRTTRYTSRRESSLAPCQASNYGR